MSGFVDVLSSRWLLTTEEPAAAGAGDQELASPEELLALFGQDGSRSVEEYLAERLASLAGGKWE